MRLPLPPLVSVIIGFAAFAVFPAAPAVAQGGNGNRAALLVGNVGDPSHPQTFVGTVAWSAISSTASSPSVADGVQARVEIPDAHLDLTMTLRRNTDQSIPATHTIELRLAPQRGGPVEALKVVEAPMMRANDSPAGKRLAAIPAQITNDLVLIGLNQGPEASANLDLLRSSAWFDLPIRLEHDRVAKLTIEEGPLAHALLEKLSQ
jgi:hypothetical protein